MRRRQAPGSLESAIGNCTVAARTGGRFQSTHDLIAAADAGDERGEAVVAPVGPGARRRRRVIHQRARPGSGRHRRRHRRAGKSLFDPLAEYLESF